MCAQRRNGYHMCCENDAYAIAFDIMQRQKDGEYPSLDVNALDSHRDSPLHVAFDKGSKRMVELLLQHPKIDLSVVNGDGMSPMHCCAELGRVDLMEKLCFAINAKGLPWMRRWWHGDRISAARDFLEGEHSRPVSPLILAIKHERFDIVKYFCNPPPHGLGCNLNRCRDWSTGDLPMHVCAPKGDQLMKTEMVIYAPNGDQLMKTDMVRFLLDKTRANFANVHELNHKGQDPAAIAHDEKQVQFENLMNKMKLEVVDGRRMVDGKSWSEEGADPMVKEMRLQLFDAKLRPLQQLPEAGPEAAADVALPSTLPPMSRGPQFPWLCAQE